MTINAITFNFTNPTLDAPKPAEIWLDDTKVDSPLTQKSMDAMAAIVDNLFARWKINGNKAAYETFKTCPTFSATINLTSEEGKPTVTFLDCTEKLKIILPLKPDTAATLDLKSLVQLTVIRPLRNGNNICFINAIFQALMNVPELKEALIAGHESKVERENESWRELDNAIIAAERTVEQTQTELQELTKGYAWYSYIFPDQTYLDCCNRLQRQSRNYLDLESDQKDLQASIEASITLNNALKSYHTQAIYLNDLRGFIARSFGSSRQEDASELLGKIFEPLVYLLENPDKTTSSILSTLKKITFKFGEEKQLEPYLPKANEAEALKKVLADKNGVSKLPANGFLGRLENSLIVSIDIPDQKVHLQELLSSQFTMQKPSEQDELSSYEHNNEKGWYQVSEKRLALKTLDDKTSAPEYLILQLKRFKVNPDQSLSKIRTEVELTKDNKVTLIVNDKPETYEIHTTVLHSGTTPRGGHYFSYVKKNGTWYEANDGAPVVKLDNLPATTAKEVYLIFLKKI